MTTLSARPVIEGPVLYGCDIYHGDGDIQMHDLIRAGLYFVSIKATQGLRYVDPLFSTNWARAKAVGLKRMAYHFFDPTADPILQAQHFVNTVTLQTGDMILGLDIEVDGPDVGENSYKCAQEIKRLTGYWPAIYTSDSFYQENLSHYFVVGMHFLWIARYGLNGEFVQPKTDWEMWQYADAGRISGVSHPVDTDVFKGTEEDFSKHLVTVS